MNSPRFRPLYKAHWEDYLPHLLFLESYRSSKFFHFLEQKKKCRLNHGVLAEAKKAKAKDPLILQPDKKECFPPSTRNHS